MPLALNRTPSVKAAPCHLPEVEGFRSGWHGAVAPLLQGGAAVYRGEGVWRSRELFGKGGGLPRVRSLDNRGWSAIPFPAQRRSREVFGKGGGLPRDRSLDTRRWSAIPFPAQRRSRELFGKGGGLPQVRSLDTYA